MRSTTNSRAAAPAAMQPSERITSSRLMPKGGKAVLAAIATIVIMACYFTTACKGQGTTAGGGGTAGGQSGTMNQGNITLSSIAVTPASQSQNVGQTIGFLATGTLSNGIQIDLTPYATWASTNTTIANATGITVTKNFLCSTAGTTQISATYNGVVGSTGLSCIGVLPPPPTPTAVAISPLTPSISQGQTGGAQFTATETFSDGSTQNVTGTAVWSSSNTTIAKAGPLTTTQEFDCVGTGAPTITVTKDSLSANTTLTCSAVLSTITIAPASPSILAGNQQSFIATCNYSDGSSGTCAAPTWSSSNTAAATITSTGVATGVAAGSSTVTAALGSTSGTTVLTVTAPGPPPPTQTSTSIAPVNKTININTTLQYAATAVFSDGSTQPCASTTWASTSPSVATISAAGMASAVANGSTTIQGTCGGIQGTTTLTVQTPAPTLSSVTVTPTNQTQYNGSSVQFTATGTYSDGSTQAVAATWTSGTPAVATIGASTGLATCVANSGTTVITATFQATPGTTNLTCQTASTNTAENSYCTTSGTWIGPTTDGYATLPTACMDTALSNTPSPGVTHGPDSTTTAVQTDINNAACGDTILVTAGSALSTITLKPHGCDNAHWITIKSTGVSNGLFPAEGTRATPCISGVASMPGRPSYSCPTPTNLAFSVTAPASASAITQLSGADHYRIIGAEITRPTTAKTIIYSLIDLSGVGPQANNIILDRIWCHGVEGTFPQNSTTDTSTTRCLYLGQSNHVALINSTVSNIYDNGSTASNGNTDSQCVGGGVGSIQLSNWGVYKFYNNHMECGSEGIIFGGATGPAPTPAGCTLGGTCTLDVVTDFEIRQNYFFAPTFWNCNTTTINSTGCPNRKNGLELKQGARGLIEGNVFENCWYSSQPYCYVIDYAPKNQMTSATNPGTCPTCLVQDVVSRYNYSYNYPGVQFAVYTTSFVGGCAGCGQTLGRRLVFHDNLVGDKLATGSLTGINGFDCVEYLATAGPLTQVQFTHNTCVNSVRSMMFFGANAKGQLDQFTFQNNLMALGTYGVLPGTSNGCDVSGMRFYSILNACVNGTTNTWTVDHNGAFDWNTANQGGTLGNGWPTNGSGSGNFFYVGTSGVGFVSYSTDSLFTPGNFALQTTSPLHNAGSDGKDLGADIVTLTQKIAGVRQ